MDIVAALATQLKLEPEAASGLAGGLLLLVEDLVREKVDFGAASVIRQAVPEMRDWQMSSPTLAPGMLNLAALNAAPPPPPGAEGEFAAVLDRFGVPALSVDTAASLMGQFLQHRLEPAAFEVVQNAVPLLAG